MMKSLFIFGYVAGLAVVGPVTRALDDDSEDPAYERCAENPRLDGCDVILNPPVTVTTDPPVVEPITGTGTGTVIIVKPRPTIEPFLRDAQIRKR